MIKVKDTLFFCAKKLCYNVIYLLKELEGSTWDPC